MTISVKNVLRSSVNRAQIVNLLNKNTAQHDSQIMVRATNSLLYLSTSDICIDKFWSHSCCTVLNVHMFKWKKNPEKNLSCTQPNALAKKIQQVLS